MMNPTKPQVLGLYRGLLRQSRKIDNYNFRSHAVRRSKQGFQDCKGLQGEALAQKYDWGVKQLGMVTRARVIGLLYPEEENVMQRSLKSLEKLA